MPVLASLVCGFVFGLGLTASGMIQPAKVLGFLDVFGIPRGSWDRSLAVVMAAGLTVASIGYALVRRRPPLFEKKRSMANEERYRSAAPVWSTPIWRGLGSRWTVSWAGGREPSDAIACQ